MRENSGHLTARGGLKLFYRTWEPDQPTGTVVLVHGMNEHIGRYEHVAQFFAGHGFAVYALDQRGFGQSEGDRCYVDRFEDYLADLHQFVQTAQSYGKPIMIGHSMGGLIAFRYALAYPETLSSLVVSSPFFGVRVQASAVQKALAPLMSLMIPKLQLAVPFAPEAVCREPEIQQKYAADPLVWKKTTPRWFTETTRARLACHEGLTAGMKLPVLFLQAGEDKLVDPLATRAIYEQVPHNRKAFKLYPEMYHEIFNDPDRQVVFADILAWLGEQHLTPTT